MLSLSEYMIKIEDTDPDGLRILKKKYNTKIVELFQIIEKSNNLLREIYEYK